MNTNTQLEPKTKEIGMGVRREASVVSDIQRKINELRTRTSGVVQYQDFVDARSDFDDYETELKTKADNQPEVSDSDIETARSIAEDNFADFDSFTGDSGADTGIFAQSSFDDYRGYLTSNGVSETNADKHLQPLKRIFTADSLFIRKVDEDFSSFEDLKDWLFDNGFTIDEAQQFIDKIKQQFDKFADFESFVKDDVDLEQLLNEFGHDVGESPGSAAVEVRGNDLILHGNSIDHQPVSADATSGVDTPESLSWTMQTSAQSVDEATPLTVEATASASSSEDWETQVALIVDGAVDRRKTVTVTGGKATAAFDFVRLTADEFDVQIGDSSSITITVLPTDINVT